MFHSSTKPKMARLIKTLIHGRLDQAGALIDAGVDLNATDEYGRTPLMIALIHGRLDQAGALIDAGVDLNATAEDGRTPLMIALIHRRLDQVDALIYAGVDLNATAEDGRTTLMIALIHGHQEIIKKLKRSRVLCLFKILYHKFIFLDVNSIFDLVQILMIE
jgi:ankyrin repeat protein